ncbi:unnamed protein product [Malus baccata var. baccata]
MLKKDVKIQRDNLIQLWMAQGLLRPSPGGNEDMEDIGNEYFDILLQSSLFQDATMSGNGIVSECKMHDLVHDLAEHLSKSESLTGDLCGIDNTLEIRHVARVSTSTLEKIPERSAGKLWSLFSDDGEVTTNILPRFKALRVLNLSEANIEELPDSIGRLKHLRYLDISKTRFKALPKSIGKLYNLQTLRATECALKEFPKELLNLINLRHIYFDASTKFPQGIGRLTYLRTLPYFSVGNEIGRRIEELAGLNQLRGELIIYDLEHVENGEEAEKAKLEEKTKVRHLRFNWTEDRSTTDNNEEEGVLEGLRPHLELESLSIENFMGNKFPPWMMSGSLLNNLKKIKLLGCHKCEGVPPLSLWASLQNLSIENCNRLSGSLSLGASIVELDIWNCNNLTSIEMKGSGSLTASLQKLRIWFCNELTSIPALPQQCPSLQELEIRGCPKLSWVGVKSSRVEKEEKCISLQSTLDLRTMTSLRLLRIYNCNGLSGPLSLGTSLMEVILWNCNGLSGSLSLGASLVELIIKDCNNLTSIEMKGSGSLTASLQKLTIRDCRELTSIPLPQQCPSLQELSITTCPKLYGSLSVWASLVELIIDDCNNLTSIEMKGNGSLTASLQKLTIFYCRELSSIPALPQQCPSLQVLSIWGCPKLSWVGVKSSRVEKEEKCTSLHSTSDLHTMTSLRHLDIYNCGRLESWVSSLQFPLSLEKLAIYGIPNLEILPSLDNLNSLRDLLIGPFWEELDSFPDFEVGSLMHLRALSLSGWPKLKSLPQQIQHLTSLTSLEIFSFEGVETLPEWLGSLTSLTELHIHNCKNLMNLPSVQAMQRLTNLQSLGIFICHPLLEERCRRDSGTDWPKISHIPHITRRSYSKMCSRCKQSLGYAVEDVKFYRIGNENARGELLLAVGTKLDHFNFVGRLLGPRGNSLKRVEASTGCRVYIRGKCSIRDVDKEESLRGRPGYEHLNDPLHIIIEAELPANIVDMRLRQAKQIIEELLKPMDESQDHYKREQLRALAMLKSNLREESPQPYGGVSPFTSSGMKRAKTGL